MLIKQIRTSTQNRVIIALIAAIFSTVTSATELKLAHFMPPKHSMHEKVFAPLAEELNKTTSGELTIKIYPSGTLGKGPVKQYKRAVDGTADITFGVHSYSPKLFPKSMLSVQVGASKNGVDATNRMWNIYDTYLDSEYDKVKVLGLWAVSPVVIISRDKKITHMSDLKGMKITSSGSFITPLLQAWGAVPVPMKLPQIYNALATGVVDAVAIAPSALYKPWNFGEVAKYVTTGLPGTINPLYLVMNKKEWKKLPSDQQQALSSITGRDFSLKAAKVFQQEDDAALAKAKADKKLTVLKFNEKAQQELFTIGKKVWATRLTRLETKGIKDAADAYSAFNK